MAKRATIKVRQIGSATRRRYDQRQNLIGLGLSRIGRVAEVPDTPETRGMIARVRHLIEMIEPQGGKS
jgi:large subunit ribosomal protein L30